MTKETLMKLAKGLPEHPGILNKEKYWNSAVLIPFVWLDGAYQLLFQVRKETIRQGGEICFPGGKIEKGETSKEAALREAVEELGISHNQIHILGAYDTLVATFGVTVDVFVGILDIENLEVLSPNKDEVEKVFSLPISYFLEQEPETFKIRLEVQPSYMDEAGKEQVLLPAKELGLPERYHQAWGHRHMPVYVYRTEEGVLWGMTAEIMKTFAEYIRKF